MVVSCRERSHAHAGMQLAARLDAGAGSGARASTRTLPYIHAHGDAAEFFFADAFCELPEYFLTS